MKKSLSVAKRIRSNLRRRLRNAQWRTRLKTAKKAFKIALLQNDLNTAKEKFITLQSIIDRLAKRNIIHKNKAARYKSCFAKQLNKAYAASANRHT